MRVEGDKHTALLHTWQTDHKINSFSISLGGNCVAVGSDTGHIDIYEALSGRLITGFNGHDSSITSIAFSPDNNQVVSGSLDKTVCVWNVQTGTCAAKSLEGHTRMVSCVAFSPSGTLVASGSSDKTIRIWDIRTSDLVAKTVIKAGCSVTSISFSPTGTEVASGCRKQTISVWSVPAGRLMAGPLKGHSGPITSLSFSPDGTRMASSSGDVDNTIRIWDTQAWTALGTPLKGHGSHISMVRFSPNGARIVSCSWDTTIRMWDAYTGISIGHPFRAHTLGVSGAGFSPDNKYIYSVSVDKSIRVWDAQQGGRGKGPNFDPEAAPAQAGADDDIDFESFECSMEEDFVLVTYPGTRGIVTSSNLEPSNLTVYEIASSKMSTLDMFYCLLNHGCADLSLVVDADQYSPAAIEGGSFGDIWKGKLKDGTIIAIKSLRLNPGSGDGGKRTKRAMRELYIWSKVEHMNVQKLIGVIMFQGRLGMISPWMEKGDLRKYLRSHPGADRYQLCLEIAEGVSYLHSINLVHGDLKGANILVSWDGVPKISDFDHAILSDATLGFSSTSNVGGGTLRWMAPELHQAQKFDEEATAAPVTRSKKADVYALGMTMLETISGKSPYFEYQTDMGIYHALNQKIPPKRPTELWSPGERADRMWALLLKCWEHNPVLRPDASSVVASLNTSVLEAL